MILAYNHDLKQHSQTLRKKMTEAENHLWKRLRGKQIGGLQFYRQKIIGNFIVDFFCAKANLVVELDGGQHYSDEGIMRDAERDRYMKAQGLQVLRFSDREVFVNTEGVLKQIMAQTTPKGSEAL
jgi:very-short-patch-repair endonuclease